jgi:crotonobetainyl-CoA:carnitine CoA-transferase CaiB-like acyl-CoA transferase
MAQPQILAGVRVLDFSWAVAGSLSTKQLADHGADVVKIESSTRPDLSRFEVQVSASRPGDPDDKPWFVDLNTSKYGLRLNIKHRRAGAVLDRLVDWADIVVENFTPGTMAKLGLDYATIRQRRPDIIMLSGSVFGQTGPMANSWGMDGTGNALSGRLMLTGWPDRLPVVPSASIYGDVVQPLVNAMALVAALEHRRQTGEGQYIDSTMFEALVNYTAPAILDWQANGTVPARSGNRVPDAAPHGVFPCSGDDRWVAIAVTGDREWHALVGVLGHPSWAGDPRYATLAGRKADEDAIEAHLSAWTRTQTPHAVMHRLQAAGVPAGAVQTAEDLLDGDPQLRERGMLTPLAHPVIGTFGHQAPPYHFAQTPPAMRTAPRLGEHTRLVCTDMLGMSDAEVDALARDGLFE